MPQPISMYVCGITPYDTPHLGHGRTAIAYDMIRRYLEFKGHDVTYINNFTDIDDKIINRANERGITPKELADEYITEYLQLLEKLHIQPATHFPRVTEEIPAIIKFIHRLEEKGFTKTDNGSVYFLTEKSADYGQLANRTTKDDFVLWKAAKPNEPAWDSPWGRGRPGWHIECSALIYKYIGEQVDIHGGGSDLLFPHHENEAAQSEALTGKPLAKQWLHTGMIQVGDQKMSKSLGNTFSLAEMLAELDLITKNQGGNIFRMFALSHHYASPIKLTDTPIREILKHRKKIKRISFALRNYSDSDNLNYAYTLNVPLYRQHQAEFRLTHHQLKQEFFEAMEHDFNSAKAIGSMMKLVKLMTKYYQMLHVSEINKALNTLRQQVHILGFELY